VTLDEYQSLPDWSQRTRPSCGAPRGDGPSREKSRLVRAGSPAGTTRRTGAMSTFEDWNTFLVCNHKKLPFPQKTVFITNMRNGGPLPR
jgi:hypothetical protein